VCGGCHVCDRGDATGLVMIFIAQWPECDLPIGRQHNSPVARLTCVMEMED
jgi:hypothetical protein